MATSTATRWATDASSIPDYGPARRLRRRPHRERRAARGPSTVWSRLIAVLAIGISISMLAAAAARADGDPASDMLVAENVFYPYTPTVTAAIQKQLNAETAEASRAHFPIKVALIPTPEELGAVPNLFGHPQSYADFLDQEISFVGQKQKVLVVMPSGYGVQGVTRAVKLAVASLHKPAGGQSNDLPGRPSRRWRSWQLRRGIQSKRCHPTAGRLRGPATARRRWCWWCW